MKKFYLMAAFAFAALTMNAEIKEMTCAEAAAAALELGENETQCRSAQTGQQWQNGFSHAAG